MFYTVEIYFDEKNITNQLSKKKKSMFDFKYHKSFPITTSTKLCVTEICNYKPGSYWFKTWFSGLKQTIITQAITSYIKHNEIIT